jgi:hypothetical protein
MTQSIQGACGLASRVGTKQERAKAQSDTRGRQVEGEAGSKAEMSLAWPTEMTLVYSLTQSEPPYRTPTVSSEQNTLRPCPGEALWI